jgi:hypothetical protein
MKSRNKLKGSLLWVTESIGGGGGGEKHTNKMKNKKKIPEEIIYLTE